MAPLRRLGGLLLAPAAVLAAVACGVSSTPAAVREVKDATGTLIKVPAAPQRVVILTQEDLDSVPALGVKPVGITNGQGIGTPPAYLAGEVRGIPIVGNLLQPVIDKAVEAPPW
ncbi:ABC transporter substrate-binding protein [Nonomuraea sp. PA05]|uniref:ABC transporter substrate-binding protein n=1 Tax=Nonomuraea sp. PA05 TaxID=2604466 RepID=UPI0011DC1592|nr:ABC transporter substrate-binding protein [Nonomuraea sp. PA05]TYB46062.1 ABC transporter substrate-binding protein [Nonomuraea sp. PA05]